LAPVFQAETYAIQQCVSTMKSISVTGELINIYSDSQSILKALDNHKIVSRQVWECAQGLNELTKVNFVNLIWVPGHSGILGNDKADYLASTAGSEPFISPEPILPISYSMIKSSIGNWAQKQSDVYWELMNTCRQTKMFLEHRSKARSRELLNLPRILLHTVTEIITGHNTLSRHMNIMGLNNDPLCKHCEGEQETSLHFISQCSYYVTTRMSIWGKPVLDPDDMKRIRVKNLARFILKSRGFLVNETSN